MPHLDVNGASLYYETDGHISSPAVLLIHAGVASLRMWDPQVAALATEHFVIRFDTRGFGETEAADVPFSNRQDALDAAKDWDALARREVELWDFGPNRSAADLDPDFVELAYALNAVNVRHGDEDPTPIPLEPPAYDRVVDIAVPALIMVGDHDLSPTLAQYEYLVSTIPGADGCRFPDSAHIPSVEQPEEFERVLLEWLSEHGL